MDSTEVGRYGTLRLMKRLEPHKVVASYPIDEEEITFGRDPSCSIRLYYDAVSALHAKIIFRDRKAFLVVLGTNGVIVDGCPVFPSTTTSGSPVTVPLPNNSSIEINKKTFTFSYPPKDLRQALLDTPSQPTPDKKKRRRTLRMSMIQSAQVFTPRPSQDPRENLRILKTPIKTPFSSHSQAKTPQFGGRGRRRRESSPLKRGTYLPPQPEEDSDSDEEPEADIVLVETNHPKVVEEDRDLVILEHVNVSVPEPAPEPQDTKPVVQFPVPQNEQPSVVQTPQRRRRGGRASLHRAVLIRSAQRAVSGMRGEMEEEEEEDGDGEEEEVEETIQALEEVEEGDEEEEGYEHEEDGGGLEENDVDSEEREEREEEEEQKEEEAQKSTPLSGWRKSLGFVTGWALRSPAPPSAAQEEHTRTPSPEPEDMDVEPSSSHPPRRTNLAASSPRRTTPSKSPRRSHQHPTRFMTPQVSRISSTGGRQRGRIARYSVGGFTPGGIYGSLQVPVGEKQNGSGSGVSGPRRVRVVEPWKVEDLVIPTTGGAASAGAVEEEEDVEEEWHDEDEEQEDGEGREEEREEREEREREERVGSVGMRVSVSPSKRPVVSDAERKAILERRRSALTAPDTFFGGQVPGSRRMSLFPATSPLKQSPAKPSMSPFKGMATSPWKGMSSTPFKGMSTPARRIPAPSFGSVAEEEENPFAPPPESSSSHLEHHQYEEDDELAPPEEEEQEEKEDTQVLLARMKQTVENAKRRQSMGVGRPSIGVGVTPRKTSESGFSLLAPDAGDVDVPVRRIEVGEDDEEEDIQEEDKENHDDGRVVIGEDADVEMDMDGGEEPLDDPISTQPVVDQPTPSFKGVRELFATRPQLETPRMDGMREMFRAADTERVQATPAFEGLGEMLRTPVGWAPEVREDDDHEEPSEMEMETSDHAAQPTKKVPTTAKAPARRVPVATSRLATGPALAKAPLKRLGASTVPRTVPGGLRITPTNRTDPGSSTGSTGREAQASGSGTVKSGSGTGARVAARKTKAAVTVEPAPQEKEQEQEEVEVVEEKEEPEPEPVKPVRRTTRKTSASPAPEQPTTVRRSTRKTPTPTPEEPPAATAKSAGSSRRRAKTPTLPEVEEENAEDDGEDGKKVRRTRSARGKSTVEVKEEDEDDSPALTETDKPAPPARSTAGRAARGRGAGTSSLPRSTSTSRLRAPTATASSTKKAAGVGAAGKVKGASDRPNKENTPERGSAIEDEAVPSGTRAKVTRSGGRSTAGGDVGEKVTTAGARVSRAKARK